MSAPAKVLIGMPSYGGAIRTKTVASLLRLQRELDRRGYRVDYDFTSYAEITAVRNLMASRFLERAEFTHLLFIDSDMAFSAETVFRLLDADRPLVGCFYPQRRAGGGVVGFSRRVAKVPSDGLVKVDALGMGLCLIQRDCLERMRNRPDLSRYEEHPFTDDFDHPLIGFFNGNDTGVWLSEDYAFCNRWATLCEGEIWALVKEEIGHVGDFTFTRDLNFNLIAPSVELMKKLEESKTQDQSNT